MAEPGSDYISSRRIGDATVTVISEGLLPWTPDLQAPEVARRQAMPEADAQGQILLGLNLAHIRLGDASVLIDPGFDDPVSEQQRHFELIWPGATRSPGLQAALAQLEITPVEITHVVFSHAHDDHFAGATVAQDDRRAARYPHARHLLGLGDWEGNPARLEPDSAVAVHLGTLDRFGLLDVVDAEQEIAPGITMIPAPGESPGHSIVRVRSAGQTFYYLGDLFHHRCEVEHPDWVPSWCDQATLSATRARLISEAVAARAILVFTHEPFPAWGRILAMDGGVRWERA